MIEVSSFLAGVVSMWCIRFGAVVSAPAPWYPRKIFYLERWCIQVVYTLNAIVLICIYIRLNLIEQLSDVRCNFTLFSTF